MQDSSSHDTRPDHAQARARMLIEALPYLRQHQDRIVVIKYGGHAMLDAGLKQAFARNIALLELVGIHPVVVHGGGPQINAMLDKLAIKSEFRQGQRVTDDATMQVVEMVLVGSVNKDIVSLINQAGAQAVGLSGKDARLLAAAKLAAAIPGGASREIIDLGNVGEVTRVNTHFLLGLIRDRFVPVIAPIGVDEAGRTYNINADTVAGAVAGALGASRLLILTDVAGILDKAGALIPSITMREAAGLYEEGVIVGGMIPKVNCCLDALRAGVGTVTVVDGRVENCLLLELLTDKGIGTQIVP
jgi:acetylglutamate kinase